MGVIVARTLLWLPIHRRVEEAYERERDRTAVERRKELETVWGQAYDQIPRDARITDEGFRAMGPWFLNDAIGAVELGHDGGRCLAADLYFRAKNLPKTHRLRPAHTWTPTRSARMHWYSSTSRYLIKSDTSESYCRAARKVIREAQRIARERVRTAKVWMPGFGLEPWDLAAADALLRASRT